MVSINYDGKKVNSVVSELLNLDGNFNDLASSLKQAVNVIIAARGFNEYIGGIDSDFFHEYVEHGRSEVNTLIQNIRNKQIQILSFNQDKDEIKSFLDSLSNKDYKNLDLSSIEDYISFGRKAGNFFKGIGSSIFSFGAGAIEGVLDFGETGADLITLGGTSAMSIFTKGYDFLTGKNITDKMWGDTKAFVSKKHVESIFDSLYDKTKFGQSIKNNAYGFTGIRGIGKGLGYAGTMIGLNIITGGAAAGATAVTTGTVSVGQIALTAGAMGFSSGTEEAWNDGANISSGLKYGALSGAWEGAQWALGAKIGQTGGLGDALAKKIFGTSATLAKASATRVALDTVDSAAEGFVQPALKMSYKNYKGKNIGEKYGNAFKDAGGWNNVGTQAAMGAIGSAIGEVTEARKILKSADNIETLDSKTELELAAAANNDDILITNDKFSKEIPNTNSSTIERLPIAEDIDSADRIFKSNDNFSDLLNKNDDSFTYTFFDGTKEKSFKTYNSYDAYKKDYADRIDNIYDNISPSQETSLTAYTKDDDISSYKVINGFRRKTLFTFDESGNINDINIYGMNEYTHSSIEDYTTKIKYKYPDIESIEEGTFDNFIMQTADDIKNIDQAIRSNPLDEDLTLFRGISYKAAEDIFKISRREDFNIMKDKILSIKSFSDDAFTSCSVTRNTPPLENADINLVICCEKGTPALDMSDFTDIEREEEVLLALNQKFHPIDVQKIDNKLNIFLSAANDQPNVAKIYDSIDAEAANLISKYNVNSDVPIFKSSEELNSHIISKYKKSIANEGSFEQYKINEASHILSSNIKAKKLINSHDLSEYYEILNATGMDINPIIKSEILSTTIDNDKSIRESISKGAYVEIESSLKDMFGITDQDIVKEVHKDLLGGDMFVSRGIGNGINWDKYIDTMGENFSIRMQQLIDSGKEPVLWSNIDDQYHSHLNSTFATIENTTIGENVYFLDAVYSNWNYKNTNLPELETFWKKLSKNYTDNCCKAINPETNSPYTKIKFLYPSTQKPTSCFGNIFKSTELPALLENGTIKEITMTQVNPNTMEILNTKDIDISDLIDYYADIKSFNNNYVNKKMFNRFQEKVKEAFK